GCAAHFICLAERIDAVVRYPELDNVVKRRGAHVAGPGTTACLGHWLFRQHGIGHGFPRDDRAFWSSAGAGSFYLAAIPGISGRYFIQNFAGYHSGHCYARTGTVRIGRDGMVYMFYALGG